MITWTKWPLCLWLVSSHCDAHVSQKARSTLELHAKYTTQWSWSGSRFPGLGLMLGLGTPCLGPGQYPGLGLWAPVSVFSFISFSITFSTHFNALRRLHSVTSISKFWIHIAVHWRTYKLQLLHLGYILKWRRCRILIFFVVLRTS